jgi:CheY-like chemotaxis protein
MKVVPRPPPLVLFIQNHARVEILFEYLASAGLRVARTLNDRDMLATVLRLVPDLIVLDFNGTGDTAERLKADSRTMSIPLIALAEMAVGSQNRLLLN